jgi:hypothetical protein
MKCPQRISGGISVLGGNQIYRPFSPVYREHSLANRKLLFLSSLPIYLCFFKFKQPIQMKATTLVIIAVLSLQASVLFASNDFPPITSDNDASASYCVALTPSTPFEATFEDDVTFDINQLIPMTPTEATFDDMPSEMTSIGVLAPVTPAIADFEDDDVVVAIDYGMLAPVTPTKADFE